MAMTPSDLMTQARCLDALDGRQLQLAILALLAQLVIQGNAGADVTPGGLITQARCFDGMDAKQLKLAEIAMLNALI